MWVKSDSIGQYSYVCGYCGRYVSPSLGYRNDNPDMKILICPGCEYPTFLLYGSSAPVFHPAAPYGNPVNNLPHSVQIVYNEARHCMSVAAYTSAVLACRKILMSVAVHEGAEPDKRFIDYVNYLETKNLIPSKCKVWVDHIRQKGNDAAHEILEMTRGDAEELISFTEMLLKIIYDFPARIPSART